MLTEGGVTNVLAERFALDGLAECLALDVLVEFVALEGMCSRRWSA